MSVTDEVLIELLTHPDHVTDLAVEVRRLVDDRGTMPAAADGSYHPPQPQRDAMTPAG